MTFGFSSGNQLQEWKKLQDAIAAADSIPGCTNYPDAYFPTAGESSRHPEQRWAVEMCRQCPVLEQCRAYAIEFEDDGIWGGLFGRERMNLRIAMKRAQGLVVRAGRSKRLREAS